MFRLFSAIAEALLIQVLKGKDLIKRTICQRAGPKSRAELILSVYKVIATKFKAFKRGKVFPLFYYKDDKPLFMIRKFYFIIIRP